SASVVVGLSSPLNIALRAILNPKTPRSGFTNQPYRAPVIGAASGSNNPKQPGASAGNKP
ncbi:hypothetical protein MUG78_18030, partial [Gordonia alkaliphila]|uniref:hypothetical protein n=1 Tax=Gordonia alkaliphila TaxID=1053547 RepID=UPI001FF4DF52